MLDEFIHEPRIAYFSMEIALRKATVMMIDEGNRGITDEIPAMIKHIGKENGAQMIYEQDP